MAPARIGTEEAGLSSSAAPADGCERLPPVVDCPHS